LGRREELTPVGRPRVILVGDSHLSADASRGVTKLDRRLRAAGWEVENFAVGGVTTRDGLEILPDKLPAGIAVYSFGTNDAAPWKLVPLDEFRRNYEQLLARCQGEIVVLGPTPVQEPLAHPRTNALERRYSEAAAVVANAVGATFVDLISALDGRDDVLLEDGIHLNDAGYERLAELVLAALTAQNDRSGQTAKE
jgi:lysophospholipase L1-like esterase